MKKILIILVYFLVICASAQEGDIGTPTDSPFQSGSDIQGTIQNSVNEVTGKVTFSAPLGNISAASASYSLGLTFSGQEAFKNGQQINKYNPTSIVGVGWSMTIPKIVVDNKQTATRDDDVFYLQDGATNTKLICVDRGDTTNGSVWEFQTEKYAPWKIEFFYHITHDDYWKITKDNGLIYTYGNPDVYPGIPSTGNAREYTVRIHNWIGDSNYNGLIGAKHTIAWNLYKIEDQWDNNLLFLYDNINQYTNDKQTEASYLKKITSSNGANIQLVYGTKDIDEFYEPHREQHTEPDAYQERYEKKYLQSVSSYNNENQLVSTNNMGYTLNGVGLNKKRYLTSLIQTVYNNGLNQTLPAQTFDYHYTGTFKGGIKTISYPAGGSVTYNYKNKLLFTNSANLFETPFSEPSGYQFHNAYVSDNYTINVYRTINKISGDKYRWKFYRFSWNGLAWDWNEFTFPHLMEELPSSTNNIKDFQAVLEQDFYGFVYDKGSTADIYLWHLEKDGRTWDYYATTNKSIGGSSNNTDHFPIFLSGNEFVALGAYHQGQLYTYMWNGSYWNYKLINQGSGEYFMAANNNFIISLDERDGSNGVDMVTGLSHSDYYYIHYLDAEKNWQTKSWSAAADPYINDIYINIPSSFGYAKINPANSIAGLVIKDNPEVFLRWDTNYNLTNVDDEIGAHDDEYYFVPVNNCMFSLVDGEYMSLIKTARFNGLNWSIGNLTTQNTHLGIDYTLSRNGNGSTYKQVLYQDYSANTDSWTSSNLISVTTNEGNLIHGINKDFIIARNKIFSKSIEGPPVIPYAEIGNFWSTYQPYTNLWTYSDGLHHAFSILVREDTNQEKAIYLYLDKNTGNLQMVDLGEKTFLEGNTQMGGRNPFMSPNSMWITNNSQHQMQAHRIIDDKLNNDVFDIVVNHIDINDDNGALRKVQYTYNNPKCSPDNSSTFYGEVIIENKGVGTGNVGRIIKTFNDGSLDLAMVGLPLEVLTIDVNNALLKRNTTTWQRYNKYYHNGSNTIGNGYYIRPKTEKEELFFNNNSNIVNTTTNTYNSYGYKTASTAIDSKSRTIRQETSYAYQNYAFLNNKNMLSFPYQQTTKINNVIVNVEQSKWIDDNGKVYISENWSGPSLSNSHLRMNSKISKVESTTGNVLENNNGKGLYNAVLFGYDNLYEVATVSNATYQDLIDELDVTYAQLQNLSTASLKTELLKLYDRLPNASIGLSFYDNNGRVTSTFNERKEEAFIYYDTVGREDYITDAQGNVLEKKNYHFSN